MTGAQFFYTSTTDGLEGRSGWQFVGLSRGATRPQRAAAEELLRYKAPPEASGYLTAEQEALLPLSFSYAPSEEGPLFALCRPAGKDFNGRPGNFFGHAVLTTPADLEGLRPIELWGAPWWSAEAPDGLPSDQLPGAPPARPGLDVDPEQVAARLAAEGEPGAELLAALLDAVLAILDGTPGSVVLVSEEPARIIDWIAAVSYSLPFFLANQVSFTTYSGEPGECRSIIVGTTPQTWAAHAGGPAYSLDNMRAPAAGRPSLFAATMARLWADEQLARIGALVNMLDLLRPVPGPERRDDAVVLWLLTDDRQPDRTGLRALTAASIATSLRRAARYLPESAWANWRLGEELPFEVDVAVAEAADEAGRARIAETAVLRCVRAACEQPRLRTAVPRVRSLSAEGRDAVLEMIAATLAATRPEQVGGLLRLADRLGVPVPETEVRETAFSHGREGRVDLEALIADDQRHQELVLGSVLAGVESAAPGVRNRLLTPAACAALIRRDLSRTPRVQLAVLADVGRNVPRRRVECSRRILELRLTGRPLAAALRRVWAQPPTVDECLQIFGKPGERGPAIPVEALVLCSVAWTWHGVEGQSAVRLARRLREIGDARRPDATMVDAELVLALAGLEGREKREAVDGAATIAGQHRHATPGTSSRVLDAVASWILRVPAEALPPVESSLRGPLTEHAVRHPRSAAVRAVARLDEPGRRGSRLLFWRQR